MNVLPTQNASSGLTGYQKRPPYKVNGSKAAVTDLTEISKQLFRIIFAEEIHHVRVLEIACPCTGGHGRGLEDSRGRSGEDQRREQEKPLWLLLVGSKLHNKSIN